jgi:hypothetical protein
LNISFGISSFSSKCNALIITSLFLTHHQLLLILVFCSVDLMDAVRRPPN